MTPEYLAGLTPQEIAGLCLITIGFLMGAPVGACIERVLHAFEKRLLESTKHRSDDRG